jgi:hypothetical protein
MRPQVVSTDCPTYDGAMYKRASRSRHSFNRPRTRSASAGLAELAHAHQEWSQPTRGTTWDHPSNKNFVPHYHDPKAEPPSITRARQKAAKVKGTKVYVIRFTHPSGLSFLKIGITNYSVDERFSADLGRYEVALVSEIRSLRRRDARALEAALHSLFEGRSVRPPIPLLSGGNSECFSYDAGLEARMRKLIADTLGYAGVAQR